MTYTLFGHFLPTLFHFKISGPLWQQSTIDVTIFLKNFFHGGLAEGRATFNSSLIDVSSSPESELELLLVVP